MRHLLGVLCWLVLASALLGQSPDWTVPDQKILGAEKPVPLGELVYLSVSPVPVPGPLYLQSTSYCWKVFECDGTEKRCLCKDEGVFFGAGITPKKLIAVCAVTHHYAVRNSDGQIVQAGARTVVLSATVVIGNGPDPVPPPPPPPDPDFPPGRFGLAKTAYQLARDKVSGPERVKAAKAVASSFKGVAAAIAAGTLTRPEDILAETSRSNQAALQNAGVSRESWSAFFTALQSILWDLHTTGKLPDAASYRDAWLEVNSGLERAGG